MTTRSNVLDNPRDIPQLVEALAESADSGGASIGIGQFRSGYIYPIMIAHHWQSAVVTINGRQIIANVRSAIFDVPVHHFSFAPGSTVLSFSNGTHRQFFELVQRGGNAALAFAHRSDYSQVILPKAGDQIAWRAASEEEQAP
ncbi:MAG: hypothetical protein AAFW82_04210 [Pseudomonadota bacterium]